MSRALLAGLTLYFAGCGGSVAISPTPGADATPQTGSGGSSATGSGVGTTTGSGTGGDMLPPVTDPPGQLPIEAGRGDADPLGSSSEPGPDSGSQPGDPDAQPPLPAIYRMHVAARYGVPLANATGIACDGSYVWLVAGGHNAFNHTLAHVELVSSTVDKSYQLENLIEQLGTGVYGIAQLAGSVFIAVSGNTNKIVRVDGATGKVLGQFASPTELGPSDLDVTEDGHLVESTGTGDVFTLDAQNGAVSAHFTAGDFGRDDGVAVRGKEAFVGSLFGGLDVYALTTGAPIGHVTKEDGAEFKQDVDVGPMCFNGAKLLVLSRIGITEYEVRASSSP